MTKTRCDECSNLLITANCFNGRYKCIYCGYSDSLYLDGVLKNENEEKVKNGDFNEKKKK